MTAPHTPHRAILACRLGSAVVANWRVVGMWQTPNSTTVACQTVAGVWNADSVISPYALWQPQYIVVATFIELPVVSLWARKALLATLCGQCVNISNFKQHALHVCLDGFFQWLPYTYIVYSMLHKYVWSCNQEIDSKARGLNS